MTGCLLLLLLGGRRATTTTMTAGAVGDGAVRVEVSVADPPVSPICCSFHSLTPKLALDLVLTLTLTLVLALVLFLSRTLALVVVVWCVDGWKGTSGQLVGDRGSYAPRKPHTSPVASPGTRVSE